MALRHWPQAWKEVRAWVPRRREQSLEPHPASMTTRDTSKGLTPCSTGFMPTLDTCGDREMKLPELGARIVQVVRDDGSAGEESHLGWKIGAAAHGSKGEWCGGGRTSALGSFAALISSPCNWYRLMRRAFGLGWLEGGSSGFAA